jgi:hypothetical protein
MIRLWKIWVAVDTPETQIKKIGITIDADENVRTAVATKYAVMVVR